jgi:hypothetical protein
VQGLQRKKYYLSVLRPSAWNFFPASLKEHPNDESNSGEKIVFGNWHAEEQSPQRKNYNLGVLRPSAWGHFLHITH